MGIRERLRAVRRCEKIVVPALACLPVVAVLRDPVWGSAIAEDRRIVEGELVDVGGPSIATTARREGSRTWDDLAGMTVVSAVLFIVLALKVAWNFMIPYALRRRARDAEGGERGTSLMLAIEWLLVVAITGASAISGGQTWLDDPVRASLVAVGIVLASYLHLVLASIIFGVIDSRRRPRP